MRSSGKNKRRVKLPIPPFIGTALILSSGVISLMFGADDMTAQIIAVVMLILGGVIFIFGEHS